MTIERTSIFPAATSSSICFCSFGPTNLDSIATFTGAAQLAAQSDEPPEVLRQRVTSKGGTTFAAISSMEAAGVKEAIVAAMKAAAARGRELGEEMGKAG